MKYKDKHSLNDYGLKAQAMEIPVLPLLRKKELPIPGKHGVYDFSDNTYEKKIIPVLFIYAGSSLNDLRLKFRDVAAWLSSQTYQRLIFDDEPDKYYLAKCYDAVGLEQIYKVGKGIVKFECQPFAYEKLTSTEPITWESNLSWNSGVTWNNHEQYTVEVTGDTTVEVLNRGTQEINIESPVGSKFDIEITGSFSTISFLMNGKTINYTEAISSETVTIDNVNAKVLKGTTNKLSVCTGDLANFLTLLPGVNTVSITGTGLNCSVKFDFRPQYL